NFIMAKRYRELGFGQKTGNSDRFINKDGTFNVIRKFNDEYVSNPYHYLITITFWKFLLIVITVFVVLNAVFALIYVGIGVEHFAGIKRTDKLNDFAQLFYFSCQTFTTVGYGTISPQGGVASLTASFEALLGLLGFALATGLVYGRFAKPTAKIKFSDNLLVAPYKDTGDKALIFRIVNQHKSELIELEVNVTMGYYEEENGVRMRRFAPIELEINKINFFPLNWTLVHHIDENSPLYGKTDTEIAASDAEFMIIIKGFDDVYFQVVYTRYSYKYYEMVWNAKFLPMFYADDKGQIVCEVGKISEYEKIQ
ncbi:MAG: ion channel, partial [Bacteroidia bacterium]